MMLDESVHITTSVILDRAARERREAMEQRKYAVDLLFRLSQAIETYSNDQFKEWPEYQEAVRFFGGKVNDF